MYRYKKEKKKSSVERNSFLDSAEEKNSYSIILFFRVFVKNGVCFVFAPKSGKIYGLFHMEYVDCFDQFLLKINKYKQYFVFKD